MQNVNVLIVEDDAHSQRIFHDALEHFGFTIRTAGSAEEALRVLDEVTPAVAIVDIRLPGVNGWELMRRLRADERFAGIRLVAVSVYDADREMIEAVKPDRYLSKPVDPRVLKGVIEELLNGAAEAAT